MFGSRLKIEVVKGTTEGISYRGERQRRETVLLKIGRHSISRRAFQLGAFLAVCQLLDGVLTWVGLNLFGLKIEGNSFLKLLMEAYGSFPVLFITKLVALVLVGFLTVYSHRRRWFRPVIALLCLIYLALAVIPWVFIISSQR